MVFKLLLHYWCARVKAACQLLLLLLFLVIYGSLRYYIIIVTHRDDIIALAKTHFANANTIPIRSHIIKYIMQHRVCAYTTRVRDVQ